MLQLYIACLTPSPQIGMPIYWLILIKANVIVWHNTWFLYNVLPIDQWYGWGYEFALYSNLYVIRPIKVIGLASCHGWRWYVMQPYKPVHNIGQDQTQAKAHLYTHIYTYITALRHKKACQWMQQDIYIYICNLYIHFNACIYGCI